MLRQVCVALPTEEDQLAGPTPWALGCWNTDLTLRGMSYLPRGSIPGGRATSFSLRSEKIIYPRDSSFACAQGGSIENVND